MCAVMSVCVGVRHGGGGGGGGLGVGGRQGKGMEPSGVGRGGEGRHGKVDNAQMCALPKRAAKSGQRPPPRSSVVFKASPHAR